MHCQADFGLDHYKVGRSSNIIWDKAFRDTGNVRLWRDANIPSKRFILISKEKKKKPTNHLCEKTRFKQDLCTMCDYRFLRQKLPTILAFVYWNYIEIPHWEWYKIILQLHGVTLIRHIFQFELAWAFCPSFLQFPLPAFERGHCYEPYLQNGNFTTTDPLYGVGAVVQFTCDPGHALEQGPPVIECISARDPYWNDTEPLCKGDTEPCAGVFSLLYLEPLSFPSEVNSQANHLFEQKMSPVVMCGEPCFKSRFWKPADEKKTNN